MEIKKWGGAYRTTDLKERGTEKCLVGGRGGGASIRMLLCWLFGDGAILCYNGYNIFKAASKKKHRSSIPWCGIVYMRSAILAVHSSLKFVPIDYFFCLSSFFLPSYHQILKLLFFWTSFFCGGMEEARPLHCTWLQIRFAISLPPLSNLYKNRSLKSQL